MSLLRAHVRRVVLVTGLIVAVGPALLGLPHVAHCVGHPDDAQRISASISKFVPAITPYDAALARLGADNWHHAGFRGQGIKVAVLDSGFHDYASFLGGALPAKVTAKSFRQQASFSSRESQHGILCGEVIHALAPDGEMLLAKWESDRPESFLEAVKWAKEQGAKVLSCSLIMPSWSDGEGGGDIHAALSKIIGTGKAADDMLFFASAGNLAQRHWAGSKQADDTGFHQWLPGRRNNMLIPWGEERVSVELYGQGCRDLELQVYEAGTNKLIGRSPTGIEGSPCGCPGAVRFQPKANSQYYVRVRLFSPALSAVAERFHLIVLGGGLQYATAGGSIPFPADGQAIHTVGAVDESGQRLAYSSCGPNSPRPKPDFVAEVPFPSAWRDKPFAGTSAAAPQAAALAALMWSRHPNWTAEQVSQALRRTSRDLGPLGHDWETGHGLLRLPAMTRNGF